MKKMLQTILLMMMTLSVWAGTGAEEYTLRSTMYYPGEGRIGTHTASGDRISAAKVKSGECRWVALSRDMFKRHGFSMGDTIFVQSENAPMVNGYWVVKDLMAGSKKIDFLIHRSERRNFRNGPVTIRKVDSTDEMLVSD